MVQASPSASEQFDSQPEFTVCGEPAASGAEGIRLCHRYRPAIVITELHLPVFSGPEMILGIRREIPGIRFVIHTSSQNSALLKAAFDLHPSGFVHKTEAISVMEQAVRSVRAGARFYSPYVEKLRSALEGRKHQNHHLTEIERRVTQLVAEGKSNKEIAGLIATPAKSVERHRIRILEKIGERHTAGMIRFAVASGLVGPD